MTWVVLLDFLVSFDMRDVDGAADDSPENRGASSVEDALVGTSMLSGLGGPLGTVSAEVR